MERSKKRLEVLREYGWSESNQEQFFQFANKIIGETFKGTFTIKQVKNRWFWYYKFSNNKISPRTKYLCSCDVELDKSETSFQHATQIFLEKINHNFSNKNVIEPLLSKYVREYISICMRDGGLEYKKRGSSNVITYNSDIETKRNIGTMKRRVITLSEFDLYCLDKKIKTIDAGKSEDFRVLIKEYLLKLKTRNKKSRNGKEVGKNNLSRATLKLHLQSVRMFLNWLTTPKSENGKGILKQHHISVDYQNFLLNEEMGEVKNEQRIFEDFSKKNYEKVLTDCQNYIAETWRLYCKYGGDRERIREERFSYNEKLKDGTLNGNKHKNQPKEMIVMSDIVFFVSFIQLGYGTRITEILQSFRDYDSWKKYARNVKTQVSSYLSKDEGDNENLHHYNLVINNSKKKSRTIPITDVIYSWNEPPKGVPFKKKKRNKEERYDVWETNIIDVIFELFYPKEHPKTFPSPNLNEKPYEGYSTNWYMNLFKNRLVNSEDINWKKYGISTSHHLRSYFVSYMFLQDVRIEDVIEITGHSYSTAISYYRRINTQMMRDTLSHRDLKSILQKNKISNQKR
ncbi:hypothetical protein OAR37_02420 [Flavobacteriaceae bacterium]|nr:hypothetical protein [Flavobacteriaceae bacterium]